MGCVWTQRKSYVLQGWEEEFEPQPLTWIHALVYEQCRGSMLLLNWLAKHPSSKMFLTSIPCLRLPCSTKTEKWHYKTCWWEDILGKSADICHSFPNPKFFFENCHCPWRDGDTANLTHLIIIIMTENKSRVGVDNISLDICHSFPNPNFFFDNCHCLLRDGHSKPYTYHHHHKTIVNLRYQIKGGWKTYRTAAWRLKKKKL